MIIFYHMLDFVVNKEVKKITDELKISLLAGELVGKLYDAFLKQYKDPESEEIAVSGFGAVYEHLDDDKLE